MKKHKVVLLGMAALALTFVLTLAACGSSPEGYSAGPGRAAPDTLPVRQTSSDVPDFVNDALKSVPSGYVIGIGVSTSRDISNAMDDTEMRAKASISAKLQEVVARRVIDFRERSEADPSATVSYQQTVIRTLTQSRLLGAEDVVIRRDGSGQLWRVMTLSKDQAEAEITQASNQALAAERLSAPRAAALKALEDMDRDIAANSESIAAEAATGDIEVMR